MNAIKMIPVASVVLIINGLTLFSDACAGYCGIQHACTFESCAELDKGERLRICDQVSPSSGCCAVAANCYDGGTAYCAPEDTTLTCYYQRPCP